MLVMTLTAGGVRSAGVMYVGIMNHFRATREEASWPLSVMGAMLSLISTFAGPLAQAISPKPVIIAGSLLISIGLMMCYFAPSIAWFTVTFGIIFGSGLGTVYTINVVFLQQYFSKMRGLAMGINYAGSTTAGFVFPVLLTYLMGEFGFRGTLPILSVILLHIFALCLMHHEAPWLKPVKRATKSQVPAEQSPNNEIFNINTGTEISPDRNEAAWYEKAEQADAAKPTQSSHASFWESLSIMKIREFYVIILSFTLFMYAYDAYFTTVIDYIVDQGIPLHRATTVVPLYSITDMVSRLTVPQLGDRGYIDKELLIALSYTLQTICYVCFPIVSLAGTFTSIALLAMLHSAAVGTSIVMQGVLMGEHIGPARLPMAYGIMGAFVGSTYFSKPYFIGYFRDTIGSYTMMFLIYAVCAGTAAATWFVTWFLHRFASKHKKSYSQRQRDATEKNSKHAEVTLNAVPELGIKKTSRYSRNKSSEEISLHDIIGQRSRSSTMLHL